MNNKIDFVLIWVNDNDLEWKESYSKYSKQTFGDTRSVRYRDWGTLKYWFRGIEKFVPWVNKIHFVTCGHYPEWLNLNHPKLNFVKHENYIPKQYLPTFNSHTIELNLHRIVDLSEQFVYFNDDTFIINDVSPERFFVKGLPCDMAVLNALQPVGETTDHVLLNDIAFINRFFSKHKVISENKQKWFNIKYKKFLLRTLALYFYPKFTALLDPHLPNAYLKKTLSEVWKLDSKLLDETSLSKFRLGNNVNQYIFRYYQLLTGNFNPVNIYDTSVTYQAINDDIMPKVLNSIKKQEKALICINDGEVSDFEKTKEDLLKAFDLILPDKSKFEL